MEKQYLTAHEIAHILNISYLTVYRWIRSEKIAATKVGQQYRVDRQDFNAFIKKGRTARVKKSSHVLTDFIARGLLDYAYHYDGRFIADLSLGINPLGCSQLVTRQMLKPVLSIVDYPEVLSDTLRQKIAVVYNLHPDKILVGAGISDLLQLCFLTFLNPGEEVAMPDISFPVFEFMAILVNAIPSFIPSDDTFDIVYAKIHLFISDKTKMVILCNPNNPTGKQVNKVLLEPIINRFKQVIFVIDEANIDFGGESMLDFANNYNNVIVLRSFSKGFGLAGLRVGFLVTNKDFAYLLKRRQCPFSTNVYAQKLACTALDDMAFINQTAAYCKQERLYLEQVLTSFGYSYFPSDANYLLVDITKKCDNADTFISMLNKRGAHAVNGKHFRLLGKRYIRLSPRFHAVNEQFVKILERIERQS